MQDAKNYKTYKNNRNQNTQTPNFIEYGKLPPQATDIEEIVLGQLMIDENAVTGVIDILKPESFYDKNNQLIYAAIRQLATSDEPVDLITVSEKLRKNGDIDKIGGPFFLSKLTQKVSSAAHVEYHAKIIAEKFIQRELIRVSTQIQEKAYDTETDVQDLLDFSEKEIFNVSEGNIKKESAPIGALIPQALAMIAEAGQREDSLSGVPSGFTPLDRITSGWQPANMIVIAARPAMGKTAFILSMLRKMAVDHNIPVGIFSLEMSNLQLVNRLIVSETELPHEKIKNGRLDGEQWKILETKTQILSKAPIFLDDTPALSIFEFRAKARRLREKHGVKMLFIDYLQLMTSGVSSSREQEVSMISRQIKAVAMELNIPIVALSQLNRSVETRGGDKKPQLSDLRESGAIEQDADMVMFIHRPEYYGIIEDEEGRSNMGVAEIILAKNRHGAVDTVRLRFIKELAKFTELDEFNNGGFISSTDSNQNNMIFSSKMNTDSSNKSKSNTTNNTNPFDHIVPNTNFENEKSPF
ncbi:MAG: replicative DNA helicase [Bacteroidales bacterium]|nr:replicative DNA helicase [Bacteroidales bacterium]